MACLPFICDPKVKRGLMPIGVNILLVSILLFRLISLGCAVYALVMLHTDAVIQTVYTNFVDTLYVFGRIPLGYMIVVITYSCACGMMPLQVINSVMGLAGVLFTKRLIVYAHICLSFITIPAMFVYAILLAGGLRDLYYGIDDKFNNEINTGIHADDIKTKLSCCGFSGEDPCMNFYWSFTKKIPGCWDLWSSPFHNFMSTMLAFVISMLILEVLNLVVTDYEYRKWRLKEEPERPDNTGVIPYITRDAFGDICAKLVYYWRKGALQFFIRCSALCQGCVGVILIIYGGYNIKEYPSFVAEISISRLRFHNIYFDDLVRILASLLVLCGGISLVTSIQGVSVTCVTSRAAYYVSAFINILGMVVSVTVIIFWAVFYPKVRYSMEQEVEDLFATSLRYNPYLHYAQNLVQTLHCCGITIQNDFLRLVDWAIPTTNRISTVCTNFRVDTRIYQSEKAIFTEAIGRAVHTGSSGFFQDIFGRRSGFSFLLLLLQIVSYMCANKGMAELTTGTSVSESEPVIHAAEHETTRPDAEHEPSSPATEQQVSVITEPVPATAVRRGVVGNLRRRVTQLWADDKANGAGIILKFITMLFGLSLVVTGLLLKFDDIFYDTDLYHLFYKLGFNNRRFTYYLEAVAYCMLGLGISEMAIVLYGLLIYCWNSKFLEYILIVLRVSFCVVLIVIIGLSIDTKSNIDWTMYDQLITEFKTYQYSYENPVLTWELLYFKMECCGVGNYGDFESISMRFSRQIPIYCCKNVTEWRPDLDSGMESCTDSLVPGTFHETGCNEVLLDRFGGYMITFFMFLSFLIVFQVFDIVLSARRIRTLKPGDAIDKEIEVLVKFMKENFCKNGPFAFVMQCFALCQGCVGVVLIIYGGYNIKEYPSFVAEISISRLKFHNIYFDDLIRILASLLVLCGGISLVTSIQGVSINCVTSRAAYYVSALFNMLSVVVTLTVIIFWAVFYTEVIYNMERELEDLFATSQFYDPYLHFARELVGILACCGITGQLDYRNLIPSGSFDRISQYCNTLRPCIPVLQDSFKTFSCVGLALVSVLLILQIISFLYANKRIRELSPGSCVSRSEPIIPDMKHQSTSPVAVHEPTKHADEHEPSTAVSKSTLSTPALPKGVVGNLKRRVAQLWVDDKANIAGIVLKFATSLCGLSLVVTGLLLKFDDIFYDIDLNHLFYKLGFNNRRFTYYLEAVAYCMLGLGISEMAIVLYGLLIYCWNSKFLEYILVVLRVSFCVVLIVINGQSILTKSNIDWTMYDQLITEFKTYQSYSYENTGLTWKLLYFKMECCGVGNYGDFQNISMSYGRRIPIYCCKNVTEWRPDLDSGMESCTDSLVPGTFHETGCNEALLDRFGGYMITFFIFLSFLIAFQVFDIVLSTRRIRTLKPGDAIDKEIGILVKSVIGKCRENKATGSSEVLVTKEQSKPRPHLLPKTGEDMQRNTLLPSLDVEAAQGQQPPPNTTTLPPETAASAESRTRGRRKRDKKQRLAKSTQQVKVHRLESAEQDETHELVSLQGNDSMKVEQNEDDKVAAGRRNARNPAEKPFARSGRKGRSSEKQVIKETEIDNNSAIPARNETETNQQTMNKNASRKNGGKYKNDEPYTNEEDMMPTTDQKSNITRQKNLSTMHAAPTISEKTNVEIISTETVHTDNISSGENAGEKELRNREQENKSLLKTAEYSMDHSDTMLKKENDKSDIQEKNYILEDSVVKEESLNEVPPSNSEPSGRIENEAVVLDSKKSSADEFRDSGVSGDRDTTENKVKIKILDKEAENKENVEISDGHNNEIATSGSVDEYPTEVAISEISDGQTENKLSSETSDRLAQKASEEQGTVDKNSDEMEEEKTLNKGEKGSDFPYEYEDDFTDADDDDNNTAALDFFQRSPEIRLSRKASISYRQLYRENLKSKGFGKMRNGDIEVV